MTWLVQPCPHCDGIGFRRNGRSSYREPDPRFMRWPDFRPFADRCSDCHGSGYCASQNQQGETAKEAAS